MDFIKREYSWIWLLWMFSQVWITKHIWTPKNDRNASTEKLFVVPMYSGFVLDQCVAMNRRREDKEDFVKKINMITSNDSEIADTNVIDAMARQNNLYDLQPFDKIPQVYVCATMWHENKDEMKEFLKSILRLDEDQCARRMAKYIKNKSNAVDNEYYELESNLNYLLFYFFLFIYIFSLRSSYIL